MNESMRKIMDEMADNYSRHGLVNDWSMDGNFKQGFIACYDLLISRMKYDVNKTVDGIIKVEKDFERDLGFAIGTKYQFNQDLANLKGEE